MAQQQENPIHWDQHASRFNLTLIFSLVVAVLGLLMQTYLLIILGIGMAAYSWLTTPRQFLLYRDSMVIVYGMPRTRVISFAEISHVELLALPLGERLRIRMISGSRLMLMMRDPGAFRGHLEDALARYHGEQSGAAYVEGAVLTRGSGPQDGYDDAPEAEPYAVEEPYTVEEQYAEAPGTSAEETRSGSYSEVEELDTPAEAETYTGDSDEGYRTSGSYSETPEPDYSGEGRSAYSADVDFETRNTEEDPPERPRSPY